MAASWPTPSCVSAAGNALGDIWAAMTRYRARTDDLSADTLSRSPPMMSKYSADLISYQNDRKYSMAGSREAAEIVSEYSNA